MMLTTMVAYLMNGSMSRLQNGDPAGSSPRSSDYYQVTGVLRTFLRSMCTGSHKFPGLTSLENYFRKNKNEQSLDNHNIVSPASNFFLLSAILYNFV